MCIVQILSGLILRSNWWHNLVNHLSLYTISHVASRSGSHHISIPPLSPLSDNAVHGGLWWHGAGDVARQDYRFVLCPAGYFVLCAACGKFSPHVCVVGLLCQPIALGQSVDDKSIRNCRLLANAEQFRMYECVQCVCSMYVRLLYILAGCHINCWTNAGCFLYAHPPPYHQRGKYAPSLHSHWHKRISHLCRIPARWETRAQFNHHQSPKHNAYNRSGLELTATDPPTDNTLGPMLLTANHRRYAAHAAAVYTIAGHSRQWICA